MMNGIGDRQRRHVEHAARRMRRRGETEQATGLNTINAAVWVRPDTSCNLSLNICRVGAQKATRSSTTWIGTGVTR